jgi:hypothetical protein
MSEVRIRQNDEWRPASTKDRLGMALHDTRKIHISLEVLDILWSETDALPDEITAPGDVREALGAIRDWLQEVEEGELRGALLTTGYFVVKPVPVHTPTSDADMTEIRQAVDVLNKHNLLLADD